MMKENTSTLILKYDWNIVYVSKFGRTAVSNFAWVFFRSKWEWIYRSKLFDWMLAENEFLFDTIFRDDVMLLTETACWLYVFPVSFVDEELESGSSLFETREECPDSMAGRTGICPPFILCILVVKLWEGEPKFADDCDA